MTPRGEENVTLEDFKIKKVIGQGAFGKVFLVEKTALHPGLAARTFAMKVLRKEYILSMNQLEHTMNER